MEPLVLKGGEILGEGFHAGSDYKVKVYDFRRPDKFSKDQIRTVSMIHETMARLATADLMAALRCPAGLRVASVDQLTYEEFVRSIPNPTAMAVVAMDPLLGSALLEIDPEVTHAIIDRLFGGKGRAGSARPQELTGLEQAALEGLVVRLLSCLGRSWTHILDLKPRLGRIETNPQFAQIVPPAEMIVLVSFEAQVAGGTGMMNLVLPYLTIEPVIGRLSAQYWYSMVQSRPEAPAVATADLPGNVEVFFDGERLSLRDLARLRRGSLVRIPGYGRGTAFLRAGGIPLFRLAADRDRRTGRMRFSVAESRSGADAAALSPAGRTGEETATAFQKALAPLADQVGSSLKTIEKRMEELSRRQEELSDQLSFERSESGGAPRALAPVSERPFSRFSIGDCEPLAGVLAQEHPQTVAMVLSFLDPALAACVLARLSPDMQVESAERIASMERVAPEVLSLADRVLGQRVNVMQTDAMAESGGVDAVVKLLNVASRGIEKHVVESLERSNPALAEGIKQRMFVFEDIVLLDPKALAKVVKAADAEDLLLSLKAVSDDVKNRVWECLPAGTAAPLQERLLKMGSVRLSLVEAAQMRIVGRIRRLEEEGEIVVARPEELV